MIADLVITPRHLTTLGGPSWGLSVIVVMWCKPLVIVNTLHSHFKDNIVDINLTRCGSIQIRMM